MRTVSIIAYCLIFLQGSMIELPFGLLLISGVFNAEPIMRVLILLADLSLIWLLVLSFKEPTKASFLAEIIIYFVLLAPLVKIISSFPPELFTSFAFLLPFAWFVIFFPFSIFLSYKKYRQEKAAA